MALLRKLASLCFGVAAAVSASADDVPVGVPADVLLPLSIRGYDLNVVNGITQPLTSMVDGHRIDLSVPVYAYLPSASITESRRQTLVAVRKILVPLTQQGNVDAVQILPLVTKLQDLVAGDEPAAVAEPAAHPQSEEQAGEQDGPPRRIGDYTLNVLDRAKPVKILVGLDTREVLLPVYFYLPDPAAEGRFVSGVRQIASTLARFAKEDHVDGDTLGVALLAIDRLLTSSGDFRRDHNLVAQLSAGETGVTVSAVAAAPVRPPPQRERPNVEDGVTP